MSTEPVEKLKEQPTKPREWLSKLREWSSNHTELLEWLFKWGSYIGAVVYGLWTLLSFLIAKNELDLVVWVEEERLIYPSEATWKKALPLSFQNSAATSVRLLAVKVSNYGSCSAGAYPFAWTR